MQPVVFVSQVVQRLTTPVTFSLLRFLVRKSHREDASVTEARAFRRHASLKNVLNRFNIHVWRKVLEFFTVEFPGAADRE